MYESDDLRDIFLSLGEDFEESPNVSFSQKYFYANLCPVCFNHNRERCLKICSGCKMISYCGKKHQLEDWKRHKEFCKIISQQLKITKASNIFDAVNCADDSLDNTGYKSLVIKKYSVLFFVLDKIQRLLYPRELGMILFPKYCETCEITDPNLLTSCSKCPHANFCINHKVDSNHQKVCHLYTLCCLTDAFHVMNKYIEKLDDYLQFKIFNGNFDNFPKSLKDFVNSHCLFTTSDDFKGDLILKNIFSEHLTCSMTIAYALKKLKCPLNSEIEIHLIFKYLDSISDLYLELILHWLPHIVKLKIVFFVPGMNIDEIFYPICQICIQNRKKLTVEFCGLKYRDYLKTDRFIKPAIVVGFEFDDELLRDIKDVIPILKNMNCPFFTTAFCESDGIENLKVMRQFIEINNLCLERNPFSSLKFYRLSNELKGISATNMFIIYEKVNEKKIEDLSASIKPQLSIQIIDSEKIIDGDLFHKKNRREGKLLPCQEFRSNCRQEVEKQIVNFSSSACNNRRYN